MCCSQQGVCVAQPYPEYAMVEPLALSVNPLSMKVGDA